VKDKTKNFSFVPGAIFVGHLAFRNKILRPKIVHVYLHTAIKFHQQKTSVLFSDICRGERGVVA